MDRGHAADTRKHHARNRHGPPRRCSWWETDSRRQARSSLHGPRPVCLKGGGGRPGAVWRVDGAQANIRTLLFWGEPSRTNLSNVFTKLTGDEVVGEGVDLAAHMGASFSTGRLLGVSASSRILVTGLEEGAVATSVDAVTAPVTSKIYVIGRQFDTAVAKSSPGHEILDRSEWSIPRKRRLGYRQSSKNAPQSISQARRQIPTSGTRHSAAQPGSGESGVSLRKQDTNHSGIFSCHHPRSRREAKFGA